MNIATYLIRILFLVLFIFLLIQDKIMLWLALFAGSLILAMIFGRIYCGYACPMNTLMRPTQWLSKKLNLQTSKTPSWLKNGYFTWITLFISIAIMIVSKRFFQVNIPILPFWVIISVFITIRYKPHVFHNLICPFSSLQKLFGRFAIFSKTVNADDCTACRLCLNVCPSDAIKVSSEHNAMTINPSLCHQCTDCQSACNKGAIVYSAANKR